MYKAAIINATARLAAAEAVHKAARAAYIAATDDEQEAAEVVKLLQEVATTVQAKAHARISRLVARCLGAVFTEPYEFEIEFEQKRGRTEARLVFKRGANEVDPLNASGGGVVDVCSFALRLAALVASRPARRKVMIMDEPFKHLSREYRPAVRALLEGLASELGMQFIIVTHDPALQIGKVVEIGDAT